MKKSLIYRAVEASLSKAEFEKAIREEISEAIDYRRLASAVLTKFGIKDTVEAVAIDKTLDILERF